MKTNQSNQNIYQQITDRIIAAIEAGASKFEMPWHKGPNQRRPKNVATGNSYRGINTVSLWVAQLERDYSSNLWGTYNQWKACGAQVRKGEHAAPVVFFKGFEQPENQTEETKPNFSFIATTSWVFNADQVHGWNASNPTPTTDKIRVFEEAESFIAATKANIKEVGTCACYKRFQDTIYMPSWQLFRGSHTSSATESYYSILLHELTHWTGHQSRVNRELNNRFGESGYAMEELVAELGAAFLCADLNISLEPRADHAAYIAIWLRVLKNDKRAIFTAASKANEAVDYLNKLQPHLLEHAA